MTIHLRFLQLQSRVVESVDAAGSFSNVDELQIDNEHWLTWDEAVEQEVVVATVPVDGSDLDASFPLSVEGAEDETTELGDHAGRLAGRLVRRRLPLSAMVHVRVSAVDAPTAGDGLDVSRLQVMVENRAAIPSPPLRPEALGLSLLGAHLLLTCESGEFISLIDPPSGLESAVEECHQHRCWPVLAGPVGHSDLLLVSPIILEDHPMVAEESAGALFDSTEIDEILTLRVLTMTEDEKVEARATDPRAAQIIDRSESLSPDEMTRMHGALRNPHALEGTMPTWSPQGDPIPTWSTVSDLASELAAPALSSSDLPSPDLPWWDPERDASVDPGVDTVLVSGRAVGRGSFVRIHPNRRADAQDLFFADQRAKVTGVHFDVDGATHVGVVLVDDPAADVNEWYGRFLYFAPDEIEPVEPVEPVKTETTAVQRKES